MSSSYYSWVLCLTLLLLRECSTKWVEGRIDTKENWAFLSRFCFLSVEGQFEYLIEFDSEMGTPNLLLYYDDDSQWPAVYHSDKTCKEREAVLNKAGQNQIVRLSHWYPDTEFSGCVIKREDREMPASKSTTTTQSPTTKTTTQNTNVLPKEKPKPPNTTAQVPSPTFYDQFLKTTTEGTKSTIIDENSTIWYEITASDEEEKSTTVLPDSELWESIGDGNDTNLVGNLKDVEVMFSNDISNGGQKIKRSTELYERLHSRRLKAEAVQQSRLRETKIERLVVSCHNTRRFRSARERWWFIAISNCDSTKGLDVRYRFLMTNGPDGDFWHEHFSADEFYVLPVLLAYTIAYIIILIIVIMCSVELKSRHLLHTTYKLFLMSMVFQHSGITIQALASVKYAINGYGGETARIFGQFLCGVSEMSFLLLLILMAKGYTITRGRLKVAFTVKLTVFMCCYFVTYIVLFIYQAKAFDPGEVLYLYSSAVGYCVVSLRIAGWLVFAVSTFFTVNKYPEKNMFYCPFFISGSLWFYAGPLFIVTANHYIDKWVRESVVTAVLLFIAFCGHLMFLLLTLPVFANKNFPYHVRTTQIGIMEVTGNAALDNFGHNAYHPSTGGAQTVIIPLTRRTEELIGNMYTQYMAPNPIVAIDNNGTPKMNGAPKTIDSTTINNRLTHQGSTETNNSEEIRPIVTRKDTIDGDQAVFTVEKKIEEMKSENGIMPEVGQDDRSAEDKSSLPKLNGLTVPTPLPPLPLGRTRLSPLAPLPPRAVDSSPPVWSLARGPSVVAVTLKEDSNVGGGDVGADLHQTSNGISSITKKVPAVRNGLPSSGEISTIREGHVQTFANNVSKATADLFSAGSKKI